MSNKKKILISLPVDVVEKLESSAKYRKQNKSEYVEKALNKSFSKYSFSGETVRKVNGKAKLKRLMGAVGYELPMVVLKIATDLKEEEIDELIK